MSADDHGVAPASGPSILDLLRLSTRELLPPGGEDLYREVALLAGLGPARPVEVIDVACGDGAQLAFLVEEFGAQGAGVDTDPAVLTRADARSRSRGFGDRLQFQEAPPNALPYRDETFDVAIGELGLTAYSDPERAIAELVRVTRPGGTLVLLQLVWTSPVPEDRRRLLAEILGVRPRVLTRWRRSLEDAGVTHLHVADWSTDRAALRPGLGKPFPDFAELFSWREKLAILRRVRRVWGWSGVRSALEREATVHRLLTREKVLGFVVIKGIRAAAGTEGAAGMEAAEAGSQTTVALDPVTVDVPTDGIAAEGLPLFGGEAAAPLDVERPGGRSGSSAPRDRTRSPQPRAPSPDPTPGPARVQDLPLFTEEREATR